MEQNNVKEIKLSDFEEMSMQEEPPMFYPCHANSKTLVEEHKELCDELNKTHKLKNEKYGDSFGSSVREFGYIAALTRISDKYNRMKQLILSKEDGSDTDERLEDTLLDMANYCIMTVMELRK